MEQDQDESQSVNGSLPDAPAPAPATAPAKQTYRSFKKKFAKLKIKFELSMREHEALLREEQRIQDLSKRIQEQNDQLLEVLLEFNESLHIPPHLRYDLSLPSDRHSLPSPEPDDASPSFYDAATAKAALKEARAELASGEISSESYRRLEDAVKRSKAFQPAVKYSSLLNIPHSTPGPMTNDPESNLATTLGYLTPEHENEFYLRTDARLGDAQAALQLSQLPEKPTLSERAREAALNSPISVYNWLRRNQPQIFLQDNENASEKSGSRPANLRSSKRTSTQARPSTKEEDLYDEDGILLDVGPPSAKGKRKRDEDTQYRPKGGSSKSSRKKRESDANYGGRRSKRSSGVGS